MLKIYKYVTRNAQHNVQWLLVNLQHNKLYYLKHVSVLACLCNATKQRVYKCKSPSNNKQVVYIAFISFIFYIQKSTYLDAGYSDRQLSGSVWPFRQICWEFYKTNLPWNYWVSDQVQYIVMAFRTSNQAWVKGLQAGTYCK